MMLVGRFRKLAVIQATCLVLAFLSILVGFGHFAQYPVLDISRDYLHDGYTSLGQWMNGTAAATTDATVEFDHDKPVNETLLNDAKPYVKAIMDPTDATFPRLECHPPKAGRYDYLQRSTTDSSARPKFFFALDLHQAADLLPRLLGSVVEVIRYLGEENCALSIVEGRSIDPTYEVLVLLEDEMAQMGVPYFLNSSDIEPWDASTGDRVSKLAELRNLALEPLTTHPERFADDATIVFLNDVAICKEDILELIHQRVEQGAHMTCAMDWTYVGPDPTFYDVWVARTMRGDSFFDIPADGNWNSAWNLFWNDPDTKARMVVHKPFQVFSCWNGATVFTAAPLLRNPETGEAQVAFRGRRDGECYQGEPQLFCKDLWRTGWGKIAVVPSVSLEYSNEAAQKIKDLKGTTSYWIDKDNGDQKIDWKLEPPEKVRCMPDYEKQTWVPWDESF